MPKKLSGKEIKDIVADIIDSTPKLKNLPDKDIKAWLNKYKIQHTDDDVKAIKTELKEFYGVDEDLISDTYEAKISSIQANIIAYLSKQKEPKTAQDIDIGLYNGKNRSAINKSINILIKNGEVDIVDGAFYKLSNKKSTNESKGPAASIYESLKSSIEEDRVQSGLAKDMDGKNIKPGDSVEYDKRSAKVTDSFNTAVGKVGYVNITFEDNNVKTLIKSSKVKLVGNTNESNESNSGYQLSIVNGDKKQILNAWKELNDLYPHNTGGPDKNTGNFTFTVDAADQREHFDNVIGAYPSIEVEAWKNDQQIDLNKNHDEMMNEAVDVAVMPTHICIVDLKDGIDAKPLISKGAECHISDDLVVEDLDNGIILDIDKQELEIHFKPIDAANEASTNSGKSEAYLKDLAKKLTTNKISNTKFIDLVRERKNFYPLNLTNAVNNTKGAKPLLDVIKEYYGWPEDIDESIDDEHDKNQIVLTEKNLFDSIYNMKPKDRKQLLVEILDMPDSKDSAKEAAAILATKPEKYKKALQLLMPSVYKSVYLNTDEKKFPMIVECDENGELTVNPVHDLLKSGKKLKGIKINKEFEDDGLPCLNATAMVGMKKYKFSDWHLERKMLKKYHQAEGGDKGALQGVRNRLTRVGNDFIREHKTLQKELANAKMIEEAASAKEAAENKLIELVDEYNTLTTSTEDQKKNSKRIKEIEKEVKKLGKDHNITMDEAIFDLGKIDESVDDDHFEVESKLKDICFQFYQQQISQDEAINQIDDVVKDSEAMAEMLKDVVPEAKVDAIINHFGWTESMLSEAVGESSTLKADLRKIFDSSSDIAKVGAEMRKLIMDTEDDYKLCKIADRIIKDKELAYAVVDYYNWEDVNESTNDIASEADAKFKAICANFYKRLLPTEEAIEKSMETLKDCGDEELITKCENCEGVDLIHTITDHFGWDPMELIENSELAVGEYE